MFCAFALSQGVELLLFLTRLEMFDLDDLMNNGLCALLGYGCYAMFD